MFKGNIKIIGNVSDNISIINFNDETWNIFPGETWYVEYNSNVSYLLHCLKNAAGGDISKENIKIQISRDDMKKLYTTGKIEIIK